MNILLAQNMLYIPALGGANKANRLLLEGLAERGHLCRAVARSIGMQGSSSRDQFLDELAARKIQLARSTAQGDVFSFNGVEAYVAQDGGRLQTLLVEQIREFDPTWIIVSSDDPGQALLETALDICPERVIYLVHTTSYLPFGPGSFFQSQANTEMLRKAAHILVVSDFLKDYIYQWSGLDSIPIPLNPLTLGAGPFPQLGQFDRGYVTIINPSAVKGVSIFVALAQLFPEVEFAAVPTWATTQADLANLERQPNVRLLKPVDDMNQLFAQTRILLVPSLWNEAFGRVVVEAMLRGVPVLASNTGGLPEAKLGVPYVLPVRPIADYTDDFDDRGFPVPIIPAQDIQPWQAALHEILSDRTAYERIAHASRSAAREYLVQYQSIAPVEDLLVTLAPRHDPIAAAHMLPAWRSVTQASPHVAYWKRQLANAPLQLDLPYDHRSALDQPDCWESYVFKLPNSLRQALDALCEQEGATRFVTLLAAFQVLLGHYTRQTDIMVSTPVDPGAERLIGADTDSLVLRADLSGNPSFREFIAQVRATVDAAFEHQDLPLSRFRAATQDDSAAAPRSLSQVVFHLEPESAAPHSVVDQLSALPIDGEQRMLAFDLLLSLMQRSDGLVGELIYNRALFEQTTIQRLSGHLETLLTAIAADPTRPILDLPLLPEAERQQLLITWNATEVAYAHEYCLHQLIEAQVERTPDVPAIVFGQQSLSYRELNRHANQLAYHLQALGAGPETRVGVYMERSLELVVALLGILKAGAAYVPLDPEYPQERLAFMLEDAQAPILLTQQRFVQMVAGQAGHLLALDGDLDAIAGLPETNPSSPVTPEHSAYIIYTSGSTGRPKGVINIHRGICNRLLWMQDTYRLNATDRVLQKTPYSFDVSVWEFFWPLFTGAQLVIAEPGGHRDSGYLAALIAEQQITTTHFVPSMLRVFLEEPSLAHCTSLKRVICSGEALPVDLEQRFFERLDCELHNLYGPTEAAVDVTFWPCCLDHPYRTVPIGWPVANTQIYIVDRRLNPVPVGVPGELYIGGTQVARGYLNRPDLTAERFIADPFAEHRAGLEPATAGARLYKTGDLARYLPNGAIEYLGRLDHQVKLRGFRIELEEIEAALKQHPAIRDAVVVMFEDNRGDRQLAAYLVAAPDTSLSAQDIRSFLHERLPEYMVPLVLVTLDALPLTPNGKLDRRGLPTISQSQPDVTADFVAPRTPIEKVVAEIWTSVMRIERIGIHDNFFDIGGHSLLATQVISRVRDAFQIEVSLRNLFLAPTIAELAQRIEAAQQAASARHDLAIRPIARGGELPLSFKQELQLNHVLRALANPQDQKRSFPIGGAFRLSGSLDIPALEQSFTEIFKRHETLRATFSVENSRFRQTIAAPEPVTLPVVELQNLPEPARAAEAERLATEHARLPFDLFRGPVLRMLLIRLAAQEHVLTIWMHHLASDGWSFNVLLRDLKALYTAFVHGLSSPLPPLPVQYVDYAAWERQWLQGAVFDEHVAYWRQQLAGSTYGMNLPTDRARPARQSFRGGREDLTLPRSLTEAVRELGQREGTTLYMTMLATFKILLHYYTGAEDINVVTPAANRVRTETEGLIGYFSNPMILRTLIGSACSFREILQRVREVTLGAYTHQSFPFFMLMEQLKLPKAVGRAYFLLDNSPREPLDLPGLQVTALEIDKGVSTADLGLDVRERDQDINLLLVYDTDIFEAATVQQILLQFQRLLEQLVAQPQKPISAFKYIVDRS